MSFWRRLRDRITRNRAARDGATRDGAAPRAALPGGRPRVAVAFDSTAHTWLFRIARERQAISEFCAALERRLPADYASADALRAFQVAFDELLTNVVMHADGPLDAPIEVLLKRDPVEVTALLRYRASAYDPTARPQPDTEASIADREIGGLGVHLVRQLMTRFEHRYVDGWNELTLARPRD
jgi:anti-sigma regulatory factor (Ser/Thr protein kinase)